MPARDLSLIESIEEPSPEDETPKDLDKSLARKENEPHKDRPPLDEYFDSTDESLRHLIEWQQFFDIRKPDILQGKRDYYPHALSEEEAPLDDFTRNLIDDLLSRHVSTGPEASSGPEWTPTSVDLLRGATKNYPRAVFSLFGQFIAIIGASGVALDIILGRIVLAPDFGVGLIVIGLGTWAMSSVDL